MDWTRRLADYKLEPPLPARQVAQFEERNRITLPEDYRTFITTVCSGIRGDPEAPNRLSELLRAPDLDCEDENLRSPFPLVEHRYFDDDEAYELARGGQLYLATDGCTCDWYLIVTGPERGGLWQIEAEGAQPCAPKLTFLPWLELRLDCDSGRNPTEWWDAVWSDLDEGLIAEREARAAASADAVPSDESTLKSALLAAFEQHFAEGAYRLGDDERTVATFPAAHPDVGEVTIRDEGDEAIVCIGNLTHEHFSVFDDRPFDAEKAEVVARDVVEFLADLFADKVLLWQRFFGWVAGYSRLQAPYRQQDLKRWRRYYLWSGPIRT